MGKQLSEITPVLQEFVEKQHIFFVGTAGTSGRVNLSPKGMDSLKILSPNRVIWLNVTGSGNESAAHVLENGRMTPERMDAFFGFSFRPSTWVGFADPFCATRCMASSTAWASRD